jgi:DNA-binding response OmpR family regulator
MRILIVEDEVRLAEALCQIMREQKYAAEAVYDGRDGLDYALSGQYDVVVLDVMLPGMDGFEVARELRNRRCAVPVLMLTAKDDISDKVAGLDCGADDYMTKPFSPEELLARVRALSRRQGDVVLEKITFGDLTLDLSTRVLSRGSRSVNLGFKEFEVLRLLMANPRRIVPKEDMITKVWGTESGAEDNNVEAYVSFLRKKFFFLGSSASIGTVRKVGYRLEEGRA